MESAPEPSERARAGLRLQISLRSMIVLVLAAGVSASLVAGARETWGTRPGQAVLNLPVQARPAVVSSWPSSPVPVQRTAGVVLEVAAVLLVVLLARDLLTLARAAVASWKRRGSPRKLPIVWRGAAIGILAWFVAGESSVLRLDFAHEIEIRHTLPGWGGNYSVRQDLLPVCGLLVMLGLALGMGAEPLIGETPRPRARLWWILVPLAALVALLFTGQEYFSVIPYLIVIAMEAVTIAMSHRLIAGPSLSDRLIHAGLDVILPVVAVTALALLVARDFERARRGLPWAPTWTGAILRTVATLGAAGSGLFLALAVMPAIHPYLPQGFLFVLHGDEVFAVVAAFGVFALGLASRSLDQGEAWVKPRWLTRLATTARVGMLALLSLWLLKLVPNSGQVAGRVPPSVAPVFDAIENLNLWLWGRLDWLVVMIKPWFEPESIFWTLTLVALGWLLFGLAIRPPAAGRAPFDGTRTQPGSASRLAWLVVGLSTVCLAALPTLVVAGLFIYHLRMNAADLRYFGWPR
jgi:hypothetical protein